MLYQSVVTLGDFIGICWSPGYTALEVHGGGVYSYAADVYSLGVVAYEAIAGRWVYTQEEVIAGFRQMRGIDPDP